MTSKGNIYAYAREQAFRSYSDRLSGSPEGLVLVIFTTPPTDVAKDALEKSFEAIGFGQQACAFADLSGLAPGDAFDVVEGVDPIALVAADEAAAALYAQAVRKPFPMLRPVRVFGREARAFAKLNAMFETDADKQAVWRLLKTMR